MPIAMVMIVDRHVLAWISIVGVLLDVLGGLYLAYDLLGAEHGPLRTLTRAVTYGVYFGLIYGCCFGPSFGLISGVGLGTLLGLEFAGLTGHQTMSLQNNPRSVFLYGVLRGIVLGTAAGSAFGLVFGLLFGSLSALGITITYAFRFAPAYDYDVQVRPRFRWHVVSASIARGGAIGLAALVVGVLLFGSRGILLGLSIGIAVALAGSVLSSISPFIEWWADHLPPRRLGAFGAVLLLFGLGLSSLQYWVVIFDLTIR